MTNFPSPTDIQETLLAWYAEHKRDLPWRNAREAYQILVSEIMLQQTQVERVLPIYLAFIERFPTVVALAESPTADVIRSWRGLGYNSRAVRLQAAARLVVECHGGVMPTQVDDLLALPGVGPYTARAVACFAGGRHVPTIDTNVRRVLGRLLGQDLPTGEQAALRVAADYLPVGRASEWNQALMDLGSRYCTSRQPRCLLCPLVAHCPSAGCGASDAARPRLREQAESYATRTSFEQTDRYARGRIVDALRALAPGDTLTARHLARAVWPSHWRTQLDRMTRLLAALQRDGLLSSMDDVGDERGYRLP